ncbi:protein CURVATURE THYLAKOID 1A, chloroplastic-like [Papaver somniferum]|uniref:protein CURVATURE THYLAKOID 1A, chloroplastic-like n=1 Tax=Papaver somniferum TaxID=3469 RepID=UPI000E700E93|nr:protein CURVATURE THYLAKOID 1A, chloroplastic-like [Papaver somniferum]
MAASYTSSSSVAAAASAVCRPRLATTRKNSLNNLLPRRRFSTPSLSTKISFKHFSSDSRSLSKPRIRASSEEETSSSFEVTEIITGLKEKWDSLENKSAVFLYGGGAVVGLWLSSVVVGAINSLPLLPKMMELVGLGYTGWFIYRYLLFKSSRKELATDIEEWKKKISGSDE